MNWDKVLVTTRDTTSAIYMPRDARVPHRSEQLEMFFTLCR